VPIDLVQVTTRDGVRLDGSWQTPPSPAAPALDAACLVHGTGGNFYSSTLFDAFAEHLLQHGCAVLRVNTRGHDGISTAVTAAGGRRQGAAYELVDDCRHDLAAWVEWLRGQAGPRVGLIGHSLGAVKCLYALAQEPRLPVHCVVAVSPPRLSYSAFCTSAEAQRFLETYAEAERLAGAGQPSALIDVRLPLPLVITAAGYLEKYGPDERYNFPRFLPGVPCPVLVTLGGVEVENNVAFRGLPDELTELAGRRERLSVVTVPGADHFYTGVRPDLLARVEAWLRSVAG
jgi:pimeloyl-ACP methyl ester carboxylesterase